MSLIEWWNYHVNFYGLRSSYLWKEMNLFRLIDLDFFNFHLKYVLCPLIWAKRVLHATNASTQTIVTDLDVKLLQTLNFEFSLDKCIETIDKSKDTNECFYCEQDIVGEQHLLENRVTCHVVVVVVVVVVGFITLM